MQYVARVAAGIREHGPAFAAYADLHDADPDMLDSFTDAYLGEYPNLRAWAEDFLEESGATTRLQQLATEHLAEDLARYAHLDIDTYANDAWLSGDITIVQRPDGGWVWVFASNV